MSRRDVLRLAGGLAAAGSVSSLMACSSAPANPARGHPVAIGLVSPSSGPLVGIGSELSQGFKLYLAVNGNRLGGHEVNLIEVDEGATPATAKAAVDSLLASNVLALAGVATSQVKAVGGSIDAAQTPLVSTTPSPRDALATSSFMWRTSYVDDESGTMLGSYVGPRLGPAYIVCDNTAADIAVSKAFAAAYAAAGGVVAGSSRVPAAGVGPVLAHTNGAKLVFASYSGAAASDFLLQYAAAGRLPLYGPGVMTEAIVKPATVARLSQPVYTSMPYATDLDDERNKRFVAAYQHAYVSPPTTYAMTAYDAAAVLDLALQQLNDQPTSIDVNTALAHLGEINSPRGNWSFTPDRTPQQSWYMRRLAMDGTVAANLVDSEIDTLP